MAILQREESGIKINSVRSSIKTSFLSYLYLETQIIVGGAIFAFTIGYILLIIILILVGLLLKVVFPTFITTLFGFFSSHTKNSYFYLSPITGIIFIWVLNKIYLPYKEITIDGNNVILKKRGDQISIQKTSITRTYINSVVPKEFGDKVMQYLYPVRYSFSKQLSTQLWLHIDYLEGNSKKSVAFDATGICTSEKLASFFQSNNVTVENLYRSENLENLVQGDIPHKYSIPLIIFVSLVASFIIIVAFLYLFTNVFRY